ncbi:testis-expressed protein 10 homolog isoform X2 [Bacillus rossius redtenbacheri]|uniref:testis-expressed protein 10 homolog isoform X2 n=1 Tax=Bacillus rossius redtenbacheri TaxID=93214 RepID=UPI002FDE633C
MGKLKKRQRIEKAKVKLKKKQLLKAQNVTDTSFKVRKIVIPTQLKEVSENEPLSKRKLNIKELTSRLKHHNDSARLGALAGLREVVSRHSDEALGPHFLTIAQALAGMIVVEVTTKIRREALKLLQAVLSQVSTEKIAPFFKVLLWHLTCAMTHINTKIQEDSLFLFDILLACTPSLVASAVPDLLPSFLNMISRLRAESRPGRTLTLDLGGSVTTVRWRGQVLARMRDFLRAAVKGGGEPRDGETAVGAPVYRWSGDRPLHAPAFPRHPSPPCDLSSMFRRTVVSSGLGPSSNPRAYAEELMPLLFETWLEVRPSTSVGQKAEFNEEASQVVITIVEITLLMYDFMSLGEHEDSKRKEMRKWFAATYRDDVNRYIVADFPFAQAERAAMKGRDEQRSDKDAPASMRLANLMVCYLFLVLNTVHSRPAARKVSKCITSSLAQWHSLDERSREQLLRVVACLLLDDRRVGIDSSPTLRALAAACLKQPEEARLSQLLCELADHRGPAGAEVLTPWLATLPQLLTRPEISSTTVEFLSRLACRRAPAFWDAFLSILPDFMENLGAVKVHGDEDGRLRLAGLLYWVPGWDGGERAELLRRASQGWDSALAGYVAQIVGLQRSVP